MPWHVCRRLVKRKRQASLRPGPCSLQASHSCLPRTHPMHRLAVLRETLSCLMLVLFVSMWALPLIFFVGTLPHPLIASVSTQGHLPVAFVGALPPPLIAIVGGLSGPHATLIRNLPQLCSQGRPRSLCPSLWVCQHATVSLWEGIVPGKIIQSGSWVNWTS
ncbi:hypothetical protein DFH07DRAFT_801590 [Mycena maculata]|uniref:Uncharacterized protein n=1 Tax=Mycena maculata TaxID=230809 RepID=A0AAD7JXF2_9AGAR|nr:hypothetical protein DFH07DRAFT_801590 [Mycena maculata]